MWMLLEIKKVCGLPSGQPCQRRTKAHFLEYGARWDLLHERENCLRVAPFLLLLPKLHAHKKNND